MSRLSTAQRQTRVANLQCPQCGSFYFRHETPSGKPAVMTINNAWDLVWVCTNGHHSTMEMLAPGDTRETASVHQGRAQEAA
jgi:hypothetical protein